MTNVDVLLVHTNHLPGLLGLTDNGWKVTLRRVIACNSNLDESTSTVNDKGCVSLLHCITSKKYSNFLIHYYYLKKGSNKKFMHELK